MIATFSHFFQKSRGMFSKETHPSVIKTDTSAYLDLIEYSYSSSSSQIPQSPVKNRRLNDGNAIAPAHRGSGRTKSPHTNQGILESQPGSSRFVEAWLRSLLKRRPTSPFPGSSGSKSVLPLALAVPKCIRFALSQPWVRVASSWLTDLVNSYTSQSLNTPYLQSISKNDTFRKYKLPPWAEVWRLRPKGGRENVNFLMTTNVAPCETQRQAEVFGNIGRDAIAVFTLSTTEGGEG